MAQTRYDSQPTVGVPGGKGNAGFDRVTTRVNLNASPVPAGIFMKDSQASFPNGADLPSAAGDQLAGVSIRSDARPVDGLTGIQSVDTLAIFDCMEIGDVWVRAEQVMNPTDPVYVRFANGAGGAGATNQQGAVRKDDDSNTCKLSFGSRVLGNGLSFNGQQMTLIHFNKDAELSPDIVEISFTNPGAIGATTTAFISKTSSQRKFVIDEVVYNNPTGFAADPTNFWSVGVQNGATVESLWSTQTAAQGALLADTPVTLVNQALANRINAVGSRLNLVITKTGAPGNFPAGSGTIRGHYV